ncbi:hypothetical protein N7466_001416 [Penicillium verhagenii]|uniref:uncharacterized protein n=1 Tax=Penicillium verhagenii TaxID=1562060 RepID=UPI002544D74F|nr:uncharacterized protein N7466_001416 [Penicillium verhagenii]KAJ5938282.1 hypothetical protein N7466_001416 [Penicillium verhagenii]
MRPPSETTSPPWPSRGIESIFLSSDTDGLKSQCRRLALETRRCISIHDVRAPTPFCILARQVAQPANVIVLANLSICCAVTLYRPPQTVCQI